MMKGKTQLIRSLKVVTFTITLANPITASTLNPIISVVPTYQSDNQLVDRRQRLWKNDKLPAMYCPKGASRDRTRVTEAWNNLIRSEEYGKLPQASKADYFAKYKKSIGQ